MKKVEAIVRPHKLDEVREALFLIGITGMTITDVLGMGRQKGFREIYRGQEFKVAFLNKIKLEIIIEDAQLDECLETLMEASRTGKIGDGKIFISTIDKVIRVRTGEEDHQAM